MLTLYAPTLLRNVSSGNKKNDVYFDTRMIIGVVRKTPRNHEGVSADYQSIFPPQIRDRGKRRQCTK